MAVSKPIVSYIAHCSHLLSGLDLASAAREDEIRRVPESLEPSGNQPFLDVEELGELPLPAKKQSCLAEREDVRSGVSCLHQLMVTTAVAYVCTTSHIAASGLREGATLSAGAPKSGPQGFT